MNNLIQYNHKLTLLLLVLLSTVMHGQSAKESFKVNSNSVVKLNATYTTIKFETWDKNKVQVEAIIEGEGLTEIDKKELFESWDFSISENNDEIIINSLVKGNRSNMFGGNLFDELLSMDPFAAQLLNDNNLSFPVSLNQVKGMKFDYEAFNKNPQEYKKKFEEQMRNNMGGSKEKVDQMMEENMKKMEQQFKDRGMNYTKEVVTDENGNKTYIIQGASSEPLKKIRTGKKTLVIRMPKNTKTEINVRHGEINMADASNVRATLNYAPFTANSIDGGETYITAAYAPVAITDWGNGTLYVKFVDTCDLKNVKEINLKANSSGIYIGTLRSNAKISAAFGTLRIDAIDNNFSKLNLVLDNMNTGINIPESAFNVVFNGKRSTLRYNKKIEVSHERQYDRVLVDGYHKSRNTEREMMISAAYSNLVLQ